MTDVEKIEYKSDVKPIKEDTGLLDVSTTKGLGCIWSGRIIADCDVISFSWNFNWDKMTPKSIDRITGNIFLKLAEGYLFADGKDLARIDVDLRKPNQIIEKVIGIQSSYKETYGIFKYALTPHFLKTENVVMPPTETTKIEEKMTADVVEEEEKKEVQVEKEVNSSTPSAAASSDKIEAILVVDGQKISVNKVFLSYHSEYFRNLFSKDLDEIPIEDVSADDFNLLLGTISLKTVFPTDQTVEKLLELATRFMMPSVIAQVEHHLLHISKIENEKMMWMGEQYGMWKILEKSMLESLSDESVEKVLELSSRFEMLSVKDQVEHHLLHVSYIKNEKMMWMGEKYGMADLLEKSIQEMDTIEKAKEWKQTPEYAWLSNDTKARVLDRLI